ncbi:N-acetylmuramoyl-L-alanine amidase [Kitasatospora sp. NPDC048239]|uniref:peptidoglycan recognition protein family protein n=1 Tax=Kitasatospora sp. NPDC048239 TaxID=3364046 RepID=UPI0037164237
MAWYPGAQKMELQPESDSQPAIVPTQLILHSIAAPWTPGRIYEYWRDSTNLESHFGLGYDGSLGQFIGTQTRADANMYANRRPDGTGAVSLESESNLQHTDPWTPQQVESIIRLGVWLHQQHGIPLRVCRTAGDPGYGYHRLFPDWSDGGTACPGDARVQQFRDVVFPGIAARASGQQPPTIPAPPAPAPKEQDVTPEELLQAKIGGQYAIDGFVPSVADALNGAAYATQHAQAAVAEVRAVSAKVDQLAAAVAAGGALTAAQAQAAAEAGARAALAQLANLLKGN